MAAKRIIFINKVLLICLTCFLSACHWIEFRSNEILLAKAYNSRLYLDDIRHMIPEGLNPADSNAFVSQYVDRWLLNQVFLYHATQSMDIDHLSIETRVKEYKDALIMHKYESLLVREEMDTVITGEQIQKYYDENLAYFTLKDHIVNATYIKIPLGSGETGRIRSMYRSSEVEVLEELEEICLYHAATYYVGKDTWLPFSDILKDMPLNVNDPAVYLRNNRFAEISDDYFRYFLYIHEYRLSGDTSPMVFETENIKKFILNQRKNKFIQSMRRNLFNQAIEANRIEVFTDW